MTGRTVKKVVWIVLVVPALVLIFAGFAVFSLLLFPSLQKQVADRIIDRINPSITGSISIGYISTNLFSTVEVRDIHIQDSADTRGELIIGKVRINYLLPLLLQKKVRLSLIAIDGVRARCTIAEDGSLLFPAVPVKQTDAHEKDSDNYKDKQPFHLSIGSIIIKNIDAEFVDSLNHQTAVVHNAHLRAKVPSLDSIRLQLIVTQGNYKSQWWSGDSIGIDASTIVTPRSLRVGKLSITSNGTFLEGSGTIPLQPEEGVWDVEVSVDSKVKNITVFETVLPDLSPDGTVGARASWRGTFKQPALMVEADGYSLDYRNNTVDSLHISARYDTASRLSGKIRVESNAGTVATTLTTQLPNLFSQPEIGNYEANITLTSITPRNIAVLDTIIPSNIRELTLSTEVHAKGKGVTSFPDTVDCKGTIAVPEIVSGPGLFTITLIDSSLSIELSMLKNTISGTCTLYEDESISGSGGFKFNQIEEITSRLTGYPVTGTLNGKFSCEGTLQRPEFTSNINGGTLAWRSVRLDTVAAAMRGAPDSTMYIDTIMLTGSAILDSLLDTTQQPLGLQGNTRFSLYGKGPVSSPDIHVAVTGHQLRYENIYVDTCRLIASLLSTDTVILSESYVHFPDVSVALLGKGEFVISSRRGSGEIRCAVSGDDSLCFVGTMKGGGVWMDDSIGGNVDLSGIPLSVVSPMLSLKNSLRGTLSSSFQFGGKPDNPSITIALKVEKPQYDAIALHQLRIQAQLADSLVNATVAVHVSDNDSILLGGVLPLLPSTSYSIDTGGSRACSAFVFSHPIHVDQFSTLLDSSWRVGGTLSIDAKAKLNNHRFELSGGVFIRDGNVSNSLYQITASDITSDVLLQGTHVKPEASFTCSSQPVLITGERIERLYCSGNVSPKRLSLVSGDIILKDSGKIALSGRIPFNPGGNGDDTIPRCNFSIVRLPLQMAGPLLTGITIQSGTIQGEGHVLFNSAVPELFGSISLTDGTGILEEIEPQQIGPLTVEIAFDGDSIFIRKADLVWGKGTCSAGGVIALRENSAPFIRGVCTSDNISFTLPEVMEGSVEHADLDCSTVGGRYQITGNVRAGECRYTQDVQIDDLLTSIRAPYGSGGVKEADTTLEKIGLNIQVDLQDNVILDMNLGYLKSGGSVLLTGTAAKPSYTGEIRLSEGYFYYLDRRFTIDRAILLNYNPRTLNPRVDIEGHTQVAAVAGGQMEDYTIILKVTGSLDNPVVSLQEKYGSLNQLEIVSILTFGQLTGGMSGDVRERLRTFVGQSILGFGTRKLEQALGIEKIEFQGDVLGGKKAAASSRVTIAKRVTPRLTVLYETEIGALNKPKISALFRIVKNVFLSGERTSDGKSGLDLIFKYSK